MEFLVIIEEGEHNFSAYSPDVPGCIATGDTLEETIATMQEAIAFHLEGLARDLDLFDKVVKGEPLTIRVINAGKQLSNGRCVCCFQAGRAIRT